MAPELLAAGAVLVLVWWGWYSSGLVMSLPREGAEARPPDFGLAYEEVSFPSFDGATLKGWFVPPARGRAEVVIVCHGRGACRGDVLPLTQHLASRGGFGLLYFDFRNHGESGGDRTSLGPWESRDVEAALEWLRRERPDPSRRLGIYGMSLGGTAALLAAARRPELEAVALESAYTSIEKIIVRYAGLFYGVPAWAVPYTIWWFRRRLGFDPEREAPLKLVAKIAPRPLFLLQGGADPRLPCWEGEKLFSLAGEPKALWTVPGAAHAALRKTAPAEYDEKLLNFFEKSLR